MNTSNATSRHATLDLRLAAYAAAGAATLAATPRAQATVIYSGPVNISVPATTAGIYLNLATGVASASPTTATGWDFNPWGSSSINFYYASGGVAGGLSLDGTTFAVLTPGAAIASTSTFLGSTTSSTVMAPYRAGETGGYLGIRFANESTGATDYGWVQITTTGTTGYPATITGFAYENTGAAITAGQVPEPTTTAAMGALAAGAFGVRAWRRRKKAGA